MKKMKKTKIIPQFLLTLFLSIALISIVIPKDDRTHQSEIKDAPQAILDHTESQAIEALIIIMAGDLTDTAIRIANCESKMGKYKVNWEGSSAYGLFQFMPKTFNAYCKGDIKNNYDQIRCFLELYPKYPSWWKCL